MRARELDVGEGERASGTPLADAVKYTVMMNMASGYKSSQCSSSKRSVAMATTVRLLFWSRQSYTCWDTLSYGQDSDRPGPTSHGRNNHLQIEVLGKTGAQTTEVAQGNYIGGLGLAEKPPFFLCCIRVSPVRCSLFDGLRAGSRVRSREVAPAGSLMVMKKVSSITPWMRELSSPPACGNARRPKRRKRDLGACGSSNDIFSATASSPLVLAKAEVADIFLALLVLTVPAELVVPHLARMQGAITCRELVKEPVAKVFLILNFAAPTARVQVTCASWRLLDPAQPPKQQSYPMFSPLPGPSAHRADFLR